MLDWVVLNCPLLVKCEAFLACDWLSTALAGGDCAPPFWNSTCTSRPHDVSSFHSHKLIGLADRRYRIVDLSLDLVAPRARGLIQFLAFALVSGYASSERL